MHVEVACINPETNKEILGVAKVDDAADIEPWHFEVLDAIPETVLVASIEPKHFSSAVTFADVELAATIEPDTCRLTAPDASKSDIFF